MADTIALMSPANAVLAVRYGTAHDADTQTTDAQITAELDRAYRRLRRRINAAFPTIYEKVSSALTVTSPGYTLTKPVDCEHVNVLEKQNQAGYWDFIDVQPSLDRSMAALLSFYEQGGSLILDPASLAPGSYRIHYSAAVVDGYSTFDLPDGLTEILIEEVSAWVRQRHDEDPSFHLMRARQIWDENWMPLKKRYGSHGRSYLQITRP